MKKSLLFLPSLPVLNTVVLEMVPGAPAAILPPAGQDRAARPGTCHCGVAEVALAPQSGDVLWSEVLIR